MGWQERKKRHKESGKLTEQAVEDLVARRVLRGLGLVERQLQLVEQRLYGEVDYDEPIWPRTKCVLESALRNSGYSGVVKRWRIDVIKATGKHKDVLGRWEMLDGYEEEDCAQELPVILARAGDVGLAYSAIPNPVPEWLQPRYTALATIGGYTVIVQDLEHFISQFGPYAWGVE